MDEKYELAKNYKLFLDQYKGYYDERKRKPKYIYVCGNGYRANKPNYKTMYFISENKGQSLLDAVDYLISICDNNEIDNVFKHCDVPYQITPCGLSRYFMHFYYFLFYFC